MTDRPTPIEAIHDSLRAVLDTNRNVRHDLGEKHAVAGEVASAWTCADETIMQAFTSGIFMLRGEDGNLRSRYKPSEARIQAALDGLVMMIDAARSMQDGYIDSPDSKWKPSKRALERMRFLVEHVLRMDAIWKAEHPNEDWLA